MGVKKESTQRKKKKRVRVRVSAWARTWGRTRGRGFGKAHRKKVTQRKKGKGARVGAYVGAYAYAWGRIPPKRPHTSTRTRVIAFNRVGGNKYSFSLVTAEISRSDANNSFRRFRKTVAANFGGLLWRKGGRSRRGESEKPTSKNCGLPQFREVRPKRQRNAETAADSPKNRDIFIKHTTAC